VVNQQDEMNFSVNQKDEMNFSVNQNSKSTKSYQIDSFHHFISHFVVGCLAPSGARFRGGSGTPQHLGGGTTGWKTTTWDWWIS